MCVIELFRSLHPRKVAGCGCQMCDIVSCHLPMRQAYMGEDLHVWVFGGASEGLVVYCFFYSLPYASRAGDQPPESPLPPSLAPSQKRCVVNGRITKAGNKGVLPFPPFSSSLAPSPRPSPLVRYPSAKQALPSFLPIFLPYFLTGPCTLCEGTVSPLRPYGGIRDTFSSRVFRPRGQELQERR